MSKSNSQMTYMRVEKIGPRKRKSKHTYHLLNNSGLYHISHILLVWFYVFSPHTHITCMGHPPIVSLLWRHPQPPFLWGHPQRLRISNLTTSRPHHNLVNLHWATRYLSLCYLFSLRPNCPPIFYISHLL